MKKARYSHTYCFETSWKTAAWKNEKKTRKFNEVTSPGDIL
jgi:hypothetical protein